jgi:hypothetical protein
MYAWMIPKLDLTLYFLRFDVDVWRAPVPSKVRPRLRHFDHTCWSDSQWEHIGHRSQAWQKANARKAWPSQAYGLKQIRQASWQSTVTCFILWHPMDQDQIRSRFGVTWPLIGYSHMAIGLVRLLAGVETYGPPLPMRTQRGYTWVYKRSIPRCQCRVAVSVLGNVFELSKVYSPLADRALVGERIGTRRNLGLF